MAKRNISPSEITVLDRLLYIGTRGMGALAYHPAESLEEDGLALALHVNNGPKVIHFIG